MKYSIQPNDSSKPAIVLEADNAKHDPGSGYVKFYRGTGADERLVGSFVNVNFHVVEDETSTA